MNPKQEADKQVLEIVDEVIKEETNITNELNEPIVENVIEIENEEEFLSMPYSYNQYEYRMYGMVKNIEAFSFINALLLIVLILVIARRKKTV
jgi:hypothetical protein|nr:hypothetical protein [uncultured Lachnoclostridium sp.]